MSEVIQAIGKSLAEEKLRHGANWVAGAAGVGASTIGSVPGYLAIIVPIFSIIVSVVLIRKALIDTRVKRKEEILLDLQIAKVETLLKSKKDQSTPD